jgi:1-pyrroline-5-carboxylate dehydrogenase
MPKGSFRIPAPVNEPVKAYAPGSPERKELAATYAALYQQAPVEVPIYIGNRRVHTEKKRPLSPPHEHSKVIGYASVGDASHVKDAIEAALGARQRWAAMTWEHRASIFLKAADLLAGPYRARMNAATMLCQSKNAFQAEIDAACELIDFFRFNAYYMQQIYNDQPGSLPGMWNRMEYRPLEGFVFALTPFNFTSIAANLPAAPAMMGNVVVWKPADSQIYSAQIIMEIFQAAGLPDGVINMVTVSGQTAGDVIFKHPQFAGLHFTGSTGVFKTLWKEIGQNIDRYTSYPRIVGETGGKDFVIAHPSADAAEVAVGLLRGAFEFQGQKCSAASRAYIPESLWPAVQEKLLTDLASLKMGAPDVFSNFVNAVIDRKSFDKIKGYIAFIKAQPDASIISGGVCDDSVGYFIQPTVVLTTNPKFRTMCEEIFGPVLTIYVYKDEAWTDTLHLVDTTSEYALTGAVFSRDRYAIEEATRILENAAGNFYINDKPTGAVVGQQPFGGARGSGTNDKAGSYLNLIRWISARTIKETLAPPTDYRYPFLAD